MTLVQIPMMATMGLMTTDLFVLGALALIPLFVGMPVGAWIAKSISSQNFDRIVLVVLTALAVKLLLGAMT